MEQTMHLGSGEIPLLIVENHVPSWKLPCWGGIHAQNLDAELLGLGRDITQWGGFKKCGEGPEGAGGLSSVAPPGNDADWGCTAPAPYTLLQG